MATRVTSRATAVVPTTISADDITALLQQSGALPAFNSEYHRLTLEAGRLVADKGTDKEEKWYPRKGAPTITLRIVSPPAYYSGIFLSDNGRDGAFNAANIGRPDLNGRFSRKWDDPQMQQNDNNPANEVFDIVKAELAKIGRYPQFKADMEVQIVPESGEMTGNEITYQLTLSTTSIIEWRGSRDDKSGGYVSEQNFIVKLANYAIEQLPEGSDENTQRRAILDAMAALNIGNVIADVYILDAENKDKTNSWSVLAFTPIYIADMSANAPALGAGEVDDLTANSDDVPL